MAEKLRWVLLAYRLPREPSTPRIAVWRKLKRLGVAQLGDGLVALPLDAAYTRGARLAGRRDRRGGGEASVWLARPGTQAQERALAEAMTAAVAAEYAALIAEANQRRTRLRPGAGARFARLRRELQRIRRRDYFPPPERERAEAALEQLGATLVEAAA